MTLYGGIEAGGTNFVCAVGTGPDDIQAETRFPTTTPKETLGKAIAFFRNHSALTAIGIGAFGPVDPNPQSSRFGYITSTPKPGWADTDFVGPLRQAFGLPIGFDTDVNAAALGEYRWGAGKGLHTFIYLTIGTGIGGGAIVEGNLLHGRMHPEIGHFYVLHDRERDPYKGFCPFHGDCFEGLAAGPAIEDRWGKGAEFLPADHPAWPLEAHYIALGLVNLIATLSPQKIIIGGGVMQAPQLFPLVREETKKLLNNYIQLPEILENINSFIVPPALGNQSGVLGALSLAQITHQGKNSSSGLTD